MRLRPARAHKFARVGTSEFTGIRTSHVFTPGIEPGSTAWKSRALTTEPATHYMCECVGVGVSVSVCVCVEYD